ncbi:MAG TPA: platelet-activating factor acetylhydrolase IB subunit [Gemmataceae bacterium]|nr:platelet-activating factor acetylhydrolase IB subunit [Gemmataceae bacterium]
MQGWSTSRTRSLACAIALGTAVLLGVQARGKDNKADNTAVKPVPKDVNRHEGFLKEAKKGGIDVLFLGDSITDGWRGGGKDVWNKYYKPLHAANFGIGGDRTEHVLWRLEHGELEGIHPKVAVLMIGTNNLGSNTPEQIADGIKAIVDDIRDKTPKTKILLLGVFPRSFKADDPARAKIKEINDTIAKMDDGGKHLRYLDIGDKFLDKNGDLPKEVMPDALHPNRKGYEVWAEAMQPTLEKMLK